MDERTRARMALVVLAGASLALMAMGDHSGRAEGVEIVGPDRPASFDVRFHLDPGRQVNPNDVPFRADGSVFVGDDLPETRFATNVTVLVAGKPIAVDGGAFFVLPEDPCANSCDVEIHAELRWIGSPEPDLHVRWSAQVFVDGAISPRGDVITLETEAPSVPLATVAWYGIGLLLGALSGLAWFALDTRLRRVRLATAAGAAVVPLLLFALWFKPSEDDSAAGLTVLYALVVFGILPTLGIGLAVRAHVRGRALPLAIAGWLFLLVYGSTFAPAAEAPQTYRPYELLILGALVALPAAAAITSPRLRQAAESDGAGRRRSRPTAAHLAPPLAKR